MKTTVNVKFTKQYKGFEKIAKEQSLILSITTL